MQAGPARAPPPATAEKKHPPALPRIPLREIQALIPRLTTTINDIDAFRNLLASGAQDGTMPNWDTLLHRYSLLLGRIQSLSSTISQLPPPNQTRPGAPRPPSNTVPTLSRYLVHPLNALPSGTIPGTVSTENSPLANDTFFQVINTQSLTGLTDSQNALLGSSGSQGSSGGERWVPIDDLKKMTDAQLEGLSRKLRSRLEADSERARKFSDIVKEKEGAGVWTTRIGEGEDDEEEDDDDLFGDNDEEDKPRKQKKQVEDVVESASKELNAREGWSVVDYVQYMDTGAVPQPRAPP